MMRQYKFVALDFCLPWRVFPIHEGDAASAVLAPLFHVLWPVLKVVILNPAGPFFAIPGHKLHRVLRPRRIDRVGTRRGFYVIRQLGRQHRDQEDRQTYKKFDNQSLQFTSSENKL